MPIRPQFSMADERSPLLGEQPAQDEESVQPKRSFSVTNIVRFTVLFLGAFIAALDTSFVIATYNRISSDFNQATVGPWVLNAYNLGYSIVLPVYGALGDRYGSLPPLMISYVLFALGCAVSGFASELWHVVLGRALSGAGGAGMAAMVAFVITELTSSDNIAVYRSYVNLVSIAGRSSGGPIGGLVTDAVGWRWSFLGQVPIILLCWIVVVWLYFIPNQQQKQDTTQGSSQSTPNSTKKKRTVDFAGIVTFAVMMSSFLLLMTSVSKMSLATQKTQTIILLVTFTVSTTALVLVEAYYAKQPLIPLDLLKGRLGIQMLIQFLLLFAQFSIISNAATYFVRTEKASNTKAALYLLSIPIGNAIGALATGRIVQWTKRYKALAVFGASLCTLGFALMAFRWHGRISVYESMYIAFTSVGVGTINSTQFLALTIDAPKSRMATLVSLFLLSQQIGMMVGTSTSAALLQAIFRNGLNQRLGGLDHGGEIVHKILENTRYAFNLSPAIQEIVISSYTHGYTAVCTLSACISVVLQAVLVAMKERPLS